ncbi:SH3 domain-containing protein [Cylindrospermum sp. FACHB-282]|uniref:SH3 domain-containing protein n=1 Tax=Cylindrospermum sp. FACHB-282 TaxID=2692794 RepID=UPI001682ADD3|nr:SH3 domain-containing protein [Cylindrospermum sp. FACHB-282]MBD2386844.1 SH3 domain-containing protein [Cylindrospermum sp. FACHB-282]
MFSGLLKFILGFFLAIVVLIGSSATIALYFVNRTAIPPAKPMFANDNASVKVKNPKAINVKASPTPSTSPSTSPSPDSSPSPSPIPSPTESPKELPPGAYLGRVTWPQGLRLRTEPKQDAESVGGVSANQKIIVLEESDDKLWQKIRAEGSEQEGWVKSANTQRVDEKPQQQ